MYKNSLTGITTLKKFRSLSDNDSEEFWKGLCIIRDNLLKNDKIGEMFDYQIFKESRLNILNSLCKANRTYVAHLHGQ